MKSELATAPDISPAILRKTADWLVLLNEGKASAADREALQRWLHTSPQHARAWQRAESFMTDMERVEQAPGAIAKAALDRAPSAPRRRALTLFSKLVWLPLVPTTAWLAGRQLPWEEWSADYRTATGEQRQITLADGTLVLLNTRSAIDVHYTPNRRLVRLLAGEILVTTAQGASSRPFIVQTSQGSARAIGTRFIVRQHEAAIGQDGARSHVAVFAGSVEITTPTQTIQLRHGEQAAFDATGIAPRHTADEMLDGAWRTGMLIARQMRLVDLIAELTRYRPGLLRCHPDVAELRVSGAFPLLDTERSLRLLADTFPVRVRKFGPLWASIEPADPA